MPFAGEDPHFLTLLCRGVLGDRGRAIDDGKLQEAFA